MKQLTQVALAGALLSAGPAMAADIPSICTHVASYAAQAASLHFTDGSFTDKFDPAWLTFRRVNSIFSIRMRYLGNCEDDKSKVKDEWCRVAGGSPVVYEADVTQSGEAPNDYHVVVTYNRGSCWVDEVSLK